MQSYKKYSYFKYEYPQNDDKYLNDIHIID
jgi:hypothetical protein